jgi:hypothetical protein
VAVSAVRLERARRALEAGKAPEPAPAARVPLALPVQGRKVLKSLDALGQLPR